MSEAAYTFVWPLWGLRLATAEPVSIGESVLYQPSWADWVAAERTDVVLAHAPEGLALELAGVPGSEAPPVCLLRRSLVDPQGDPDPAEAVHEEWVRAVVAALRLHGIGDFVDPIDVGVYVLYPDGVTVERRVQPLRTAFYDTRLARPGVVAANDGPALDDLTSSLQVIARDLAQLNASHAVRSLCLSFGSLATPAERALLRFAALEALLGRLHESHGGAPFGARAVHALGRGATAPGDWLGRAPKLRNDLAHDLDAVFPQVDDLDILEDLVRGVVLSYLAFLAVAPARAVPGGRLGAFNHALAAGPLRDVA